MSTDPRDALIAKTVRGRTFVDVGGLWGLHGEKVSVAYQAGASDVTMVDARPFSDPLWKRLSERLKAAGVPSYGRESTPLDLLLGKYEPWDVVHCSGVLYHLPDPIAGLRQLHAITRRTCILGSVVTPRGWESQPLVPQMSETTRRVLAEWFQPMLAGGDAIGLTREAAFHPGDYDPWWWVFSAARLQELAESVGFRVHSLSYMMQRRVAVLEMEPA